ncbi:hypothetical protein, partial [Rhizobium leguminosarum]|uniref:hypothetical protein n=1 Tax=Rhizobium leguminosarum TaxID=384 RepID=UPI002F95CC3D
TQPYRKKPMTTAIELHHLSGHHLETPIQVSGYGANFYFKQNAKRTSDDRSSKPLTRRRQSR